MVILDSTILIDLLRGEKRAVLKIKELETKRSQFFTTQINVFEVIQVIYANGKRIDEEIIAFETLLNKIKTLDLNYFAGHQAGKIAGEMRKKGFSIATGDLLIAGIGIANNITTIVTRNEKDFSKIPGIKVETY